MEDGYGRFMERGEEHIKRREEKKNNRILKLWFLSFGINVLQLVDDGTQHLLLER